MTRLINAATIAALNSDNLNMASLVELDFTTPIKMTNWARNVSANGTSYLTSSDLLSIDEVSETSDLQVNSLNITFSGVSQTFVSLFLSNNYIDVRARIWKAVLTNTDTVIGSTRLFRYNEKDKMIELGHTFITPKFQRSYANSHAKYLMLKYAFEHLELARVEICTKENNEQSRNAIAIA